ncbi:MAG: TlpA family protein disulfide reductase [Clostridia bacterium]|nr:TlpA family protein disulfide reductase [Clostridia bacterium]MBR5427489.1 TlpA family protein disulfide reductase [Clostridia bacterium]
MNKKTLVILIAVCVAAAVAGGILLRDIITSSTKPAASSPDTSSAPVVYKALSQGDAAPDFTAALAGGGSFTLSEHKDEVVLVNFWATWCPPCVGELPAFEQMKNDGIDGFSFVAVNCSEDKSTVDAFLAENGYTFAVAYDEDGAIGNMYPTDGIPYTLLIRNGIIEKTYLGAPRDAYDEYKSAVGEALQK